jgi:hypothetical protein
MSEKLDGMRAFWDGGITRGQWADEVPFANTAKKGHLIHRQKATGLWSRYGNPIQAPDWWLDQLPKDLLLDGELYAGRGSFQTLVSITKKLIPGAEWNEVGYVIFDSPTANAIFGDGEIKNTNFKKVFNDVYLTLGRPHVESASRFEFESILNWLRSKDIENEVVSLHEQIQLPPFTAAATGILYDRLAEITQAGGEGLILRAPHSLWLPERSRTMLKVKFTNDAEGTVVGYTWGRETDKGSKLLGLMGALVLDYEGKRFELSGFTDEERKLYLGDAPYDLGLAIANCQPGEPVRGEWHSKQFPIGSRVSFKYRELTDAGIPKEARYWRKA